MTKRKNDFDAFMVEVEKEAVAAGESNALAAYGEHFRLALQVIQIRKARHWTQQQFSRVSGVPQSEISRIERGQSNPTYRTLQMLAQAANLSVGFVATDSKKKRMRVD